MRKLTLLAALSATLLAPALASAMGPGFDMFGFRKRHAPRAAPWFLYWPQGAYFQTPAPTGYTAGPGAMTIGAAHGHIGPAGGRQMPHYPGPTGYDY